MIWIQFEITRPVPAIKSLRFALLWFVCPQWVKMIQWKKTGLVINSHGSGICLAPTWLQSSPISIWFVVNCSFHDSFRWSLSKQGKSEGLIAATGLVILLKLYCRRFFGLCGLEIWWLTLKKIEHLFYTMLSFVHHFKAICEFKI